MYRSVFDRGPRSIDIAHVHDDGTGSITIEQREDVQPIIEQVKAFSDRPVRRADHDGMRHEAEIPDFVQRAAFLEGWFHDKEAWRRWANDPANTPFRVQYNGRINRL